MGVKTNSYVKWPHTVYTEDTHTHTHIHKHGHTSKGWNDRDHFCPSPPSSWPLTSISSFLSRALRPSPSFILLVSVFSQTPFSLCRTCASASLFSARTEVCSLLPDPNLHPGLIAQTSTLFTSCLFLFVALLDFVTGSRLEWQILPVAPEYLGNVPV